MLHDRQPGGAHQPAGHAPGAVVLGVPEQDQRLVGEIQVAGIDEHLARCRELLRAALALNPPQPRLQRRGPGRPDQPVLRIQHLEQPPEPPGPTLRRVRAVLRGPEGVIGDEELAPLSTEHAPHLLGVVALVRLPPVGQVREPEHLRDRGLAHLGRAGEDDEPVPSEHIPGAFIRARRPEHPRQLLSPADVERGTTTNIGVDQAVEIPKPQDGWHRRPQLRIAIEACRDLRRSQYDHAQISRARIRAQSRSRVRGVEVRHDQQPLRPVGRHAHDAIPEPRHTPLRRGPAPDPDARHGDGTSEPVPPIPERERAVHPRDPRGVATPAPLQPPQPCIRLEHQRA